MSGATSAVKALQAAILDPMKRVAAAVDQARTAQADYREADDIMEVMGAAAGMILALEAMKKAAADAETATRAALAEAMSLGATQFRTISHVISLKAGVPGAIITDGALVPRELWSAPEPTPDRTEIAKRLRRGEQIPGATLSNGAAPSVQIRRITP